MSFLRANFLFLSFLANAMPIYEFYSSDTNKIYTFFARSSTYADSTPRCPDGDGCAMQKLVSGFSVTGGASKEEDSVGDLAGGGDDPFSGMSESQMAAAMHEMEKTVGSMDEENPDPRQMGQLMRKMAEMTGEALDEGMEEVVRKLEEGADPDELEERMGDFFGDEGDGMPGGEGESDPDMEGTGKGAKSRSLRSPPSRDPEMYELADYL